MSYPYILSLIDAELERLLMAREILTAPETWAPQTAAPEATAPPAVAKRLVRSIDALPVEATAFSAMGEPAAQAEQQGARPSEPVVVTRVPPKQVRRPAQRQKKAQAADALSLVSVGALGGFVPTAPVFVSSNRMREEQAFRQEGSAPASAPVAQLTAEMLSQRWLRNSNT